MVYRGPTLELGLRTFLRFASICAARSAGLEPAPFSVRSQDTHVCSRIWLFKNRLFTAVFITIDPVDSWA
jgi:hypothetical protein